MRARTTEVGPRPASRLGAATARRRLVALALAVTGWAVALGGLQGCAEQWPAPETEGRDIRLTIMHTTDIHSRLLPYDMTVLAGDQNLGLRQDRAPFGGIARVAHIINRERERSPRSIYVDSGDCFQGAPIFNAFRGEVEQKALSLLQPDAVVIGNHEFDEGPRNYAEKLQDFATYPVLAANYLFEPGQALNELVKPVEIINVDGLVIGFIGMANFSSIAAITDIGNNLHLVPMDLVTTVQEWIDILQPQCDLIIGISHAGLDEDEHIIKHTVGLDAIMGGHLHVVLNPPKVIQDAAGRDVILAHSGAFTKFVGKLDVVVRDGDILAHDYTVYPVDSRVPEDTVMLDMLEPYRLKLQQMIDLESVYGYASKLIRRFGFDGGDSPLGNLVAESIRQYARADFGMTNSLGIRTDLNPGAIGLDQLYNIFPFNNFVTTMYLSGADVRDLLDFVTLRSAGRGCATQVQISGIRFTMDCAADPPRAKDIVLTNCGDPTLPNKTGCFEIPLDDNAVYEMATNDYIAQGGSGFNVLQINNTQIITDVALRDAMLERIVRATPCVESCRRPDGSLMLEGCVQYENCTAALEDFYDDVCINIANTTLGEVEEVERCAVAVGGECQFTGDCYTESTCTPETCAACVSGTDCAEGTRCEGGFCEPANLMCREGQCRRTCEVDADCPGSWRSLAQGQALCVEGLCEPRAGSPCEDDTGCVDPAAMCAEGGCTPCAFAAACTDGQQCIGGYCVTPVATCVERICRPVCQGPADCQPGESCAANGVCMPTVCLADQDRETACYIQAEWRAAERCISVPCPDAYSDGRIGRILPKNLDELPSDGNPDDTF